MRIRVHVLFGDKAVPEASSPRGGNFRRVGWLTIWGAKSGFLWGKGLGSAQTPASHVCSLPFGHIEIAGVLELSDPRTGVLHLGTIGLGEPDHSLWWGGSV